MRGPLICIRIEANGSATYLTKVAAPDAKQQTDDFGYSVSQSGNILAVGAYLADPGGTAQCWGRLSVSGSRPMALRLT